MYATIARKAKIISDTSFESGMSEDYAIPPDALSQNESTYMDASLPSILLRTSYVDSPNKKMETLEKVSNPNRFKLESNLTNLMHFRLNHFRAVWPFGKIRWQIEDMAQTMVCAEKWHAHLLEEPKRCAPKAARPNSTRRTVSHHKSRWRVHI